MWALLLFSEHKINTGLLQEIQIREKEKACNLIYCNIYIRGIYLHFGLVELKAGTCRPPVSSQTGPGREREAEPRGPGPGQKPAAGHCDTIQVSSTKANYSSCSGRVIIFQPKKGRNLPKVSWTVENEQRNEPRYLVPRLMLVTGLSCLQRLTSCFRLLIKVQTALHTWMARTVPGVVPGASQRVAHVQASLSQGPVNMCTCPLILTRDADPGCSSPLGKRTEHFHITTHILPSTLSYL